ncbi:MAG TPA: polysaccharide deacetylase family protein [Candidatus Paceibacterota bacterium]|nr:polysaccharide deacetylase family protein [Candidatus Paceibacterota bacterium]
MNPRPFAVWGLVCLFVLAPAVSAAATLRVRTESALPLQMLRDKDVTAPIGASIRPARIPASAPLLQMHALSVAQPAQQNLIGNASLETAGSNGMPAGWHQGGYGSNTRTFAYPASPAHDGSVAASVSITKYGSGDAKWYFDPVPVTGGATYQFSDWYVSTVPSEVDVQVTHTDGSITYLVLGAPAASATYAQFSASFTAPSDAASVTIFHVIDSVGTLTVDQYALTDAADDTPVNDVPNGNLDAEEDGMPVGWIEGGYGDSTRTFTYPVPGVSGNAASLTVTDYVNGDAKWGPPYASVPAGAYLYEDDYESDAPTVLTADFAHADGTDQYVDLAVLPAERSWTHVRLPFTVPADAIGVRVFHLLDRDGTLTIDNTSITPQPGSDQGIFKTGAVTFRFDDGSVDQYDNAAPVLQVAGFTGTFYIVSHQVKDNGYSGYMSIAQVKDLYARGFEIGAHTRTHPFLSQESAAKQQDEIAGSRQDILGWNVGPVDSFAYPYGDYDATTTRIVENAGFTSAAATISGDVTPLSDHYQLQYEEVKQGVTLAQVQSWIDTAKKSHTWLILTFHQVSATSSDSYASSPALFKQIVAAVQASGLPVVSVSEGMQSMP